MKCSNNALLRTSHKVRRPENADVRDNSMKAIFLTLLLGLLCASCTSVKPPKERTFRPGIFQVVTWPKNGSTLELKEKLFVRYTFNVPEELCCIWVQAQTPSDRVKAHVDHGFAFGNSSSPVYAFGEGLVIQEIALIYLPDRDVMGKNTLPDPPEVTVTNLFFTLKNYKTGEYRSLTNKAVNFTWKYEKK